MKITAVTKFKHGVLHEALANAGWTQSELARRTDIQPTRIGDYCNLTRRPTPEAQLLIQKAFGEVGIVINVEEAWPPDFVPLENAARIIQTQEVETFALEAYADQQKLLESGDPSTELQRAEWMEHAHDLIDKLPKFLIKTVRLHLDGHSNHEIAQRLRLTDQAVSQRLVLIAETLKREEYRSENPVESSTAS